MLYFKIMIRAFVAGLLLASASANAEWRRADTDHFIIYSEGSTDQLERFARDTERFDALLRQYFGLPAATSGENRLTIFALDSVEDIGRLLGEHNTGIAGFYRNRADGSFAVTNRERTNTKFALSGQTTLFHEYAHHFMFRHLTSAYPAWYVEGFAEYFSTVEFDKKGRWKLGKPAYHRARGLLGDGDLSLDELLFGNTNGMTVAKADLYYGQAWMLVHMAMSDPERGRQLRGYLRDFSNGIDPKEAATNNFGSLAELEDALDGYVNESLQYRSSSTPMSYEGRLDVTELGSIESDLVELQLQRRTESGLAETRTALIELTNKAPGIAPTWYELAMTELALARAADHAGGQQPEPPDGEEVGESLDDAEIDEENLRDSSAPTAGRLTHEVAAEAALDKALALNPEHVRARVEKARLEMRRLARADEWSMRAWSGPRSMLLAAHHTDPTDPQPLIAYYDSFAQAGLKSPQVAQVAIRQAFTLAPEAPRVRMRYINNLVTNGEIEPAIALLKVLAYNPHGGGGALEFLQQLQEHVNSSDSSSGAGNGDTVPVKIEAQR